MKRTIYPIMVFLTALSAGLLYAQEATESENARVSFVAANVDVDITPDNNVEDFLPAELEMEIPVGSIVRTGRNALCEITMPDGSLLRVASGSVFKVESLAVNKETGARAQRFNLIYGRVKAKVQKLLTPDSKFEVVSGTALAGVRGTIFGMDYDGMRSQVLVFDGSVNLGSVTQSFKPVIVNKRKMSTLGPEGEPGRIRKISKATMEEWNEDFAQFERELPEAEEKAEEKTEEAAGEKEILLAKYLKLSAIIGTVTIDRNVYARWIFTPELKFGKLGIGLYLPAIFTPTVGIFGFRDWENHDEWDFSGSGDSLQDLLLKLSYLSWGSPGDPVYAKLGGIESFSLGHGFIVDGYSNMVAFPEERTVGLRFNVDGKLVGFESMVGDFSNFELLGGRVYLRPLGTAVPFAVGLTAAHDRPKPNVSTGLIGDTVSNDQLPRILVFGADAEVPLLNMELFSMKLYADAGKLAYVYPAVPLSLTTYGVNARTVDFVKGLGTGFGIRGDISKRFSYRAEYRYIFNYYEPGLFDEGWDNRRLHFPAFLRKLIINQETSGYHATNTAGFLLEGGVRLLEKLEFGLGFESYRRPKETDTGIDGTEPVKKGKMYLNVGEGLLPKVYGSVGYNRTDNLQNVFKEPFDESTFLNAGVYYALAPGFTLAASYDRAFIYNDDTDVFEPVDSLGISTLIRFF